MDRKKSQGKSKNRKSGTLKVLKANNEELNVQR
jgi:hypothetical protein